MTTDKNVNEAVTTLNKSIDALTPVLNTMLSSLDKTIGHAVDAGMKYAPDVINLGLTVIRIDCLEYIMQGFFALAVVGIFYRIILWLNTLHHRWSEPNDINPIPATGIAILSLMLILASVRAFKSLTQVWEWVGLFNPKLYVAHLLVEKLLAQ